MRKATIALALAIALASCSGAGEPTTTSAGLANPASVFCEEQGGSVRQGAEVDEITTNSGRATGVILTDGERLTADIVVSNADPGTTYDRLFRSLANNEKIQKPVQSDKIVRIAAGVLLALVGIFTQNWWVVAFAVLLTAWGLLAH